MVSTQQAVSTADSTKPDGRLVDACNLAQRLHVVLEDLIQHRDSRQDTLGRYATVSHAAPPWNSRVAYLIFDLGQLARGLEANLHLLISNTLPTRGGSDENTQLALRALPQLALGVDEVTTTEVARRLESWCRQARIALGEVEPPSRLPRNYGEEEPRCPWCHRQSLRLQIQAALVRCVNPVCVDDAGRRPVAHARFEENAAYLEWQDEVDD